MEAQPEKKTATNTTATKNVVFFIKFSFQDGFFKKLSASIFWYLIHVVFFIYHEFLKSTPLFSKKTEGLDMFYIRKFIAIMVFIDIIF
jgi:hypothetical protein